MNCATDPAETIYFRSSRNFSQWSALRSNWINKNSKSLLPQKHFTLRFSFFFTHRAPSGVFHFHVCLFRLRKCFEVASCDVRWELMELSEDGSKKICGSKINQQNYKKNCWFILRNRRNLSGIYSAQGFLEFCFLGEFIEIFLRPSKEENMIGMKQNLIGKF